MRKFIILLLLLMPTMTFAAISGTLVLSGTVALVNSIAITPGNNTTLDIVAGESAKNVASVAETSNDLLGYKVYLSSVNAGQLKALTDPTKLTSYQVKYDTGSYVTPTALPVQVKNVTSLSALTTNTSQVLVNVTAYAVAPADTYSDTITLSIAAN